MPEKKEKAKRKGRQITVVMPCYNEEKFIGKAIESLTDDFFLKNCELLIVDGMSTDGTEDIIQSFIKKGFPIRILKNKKKLQAYGLNLGISEAKGEIIVRADAHCLYPPQYIKKCVDLLKSKGAENVGGAMCPEGKTVVQKAVALAMQHSVGVGDAKFHLGNFNGYVDTVYLGTFRKKLFDEIGRFDPELNTNEDAELNLRILKAHKKIYLDSSIKVYYFPRDTLIKLAVQYFKYGRGRYYTTLKHRKITSFRQIGPVLLVIGLFFSIILSFWNPLFLFLLLSYLLSLLIISLLSWPSKKIPLKQRILLGLVWVIMHITWGTGFLSGLFIKCIEDLK